MWRMAREDEDAVIVAMGLALTVEDPWPEPVTPQQIQYTLEVLRAEPHRGRAVVCDEGGEVIGYALLIAFWSNEFGGEVCVVDELYIAPSRRGRGLASALFTALRSGDPPWPGPAVAIGLEVTPRNARALALYQRLGFAGDNRMLHLRTARRA